MFIFRESNKGFTLLELVLSLSITGFIVAISLGAIRLGTGGSGNWSLKDRYISTYTTNSKSAWTKNKIELSRF